jgi:hypothetical protein
MTAFNIIKSLTRRGNALLGAGCYASAISSKNPNQVIKIGNCMTDPWLDYYHGIVKPNQSNPHVPQVTYFMCDEEHSFYVCIMERLEEFNTNIYNKNNLTELCKDYTSHMITREEFVQQAQKYVSAIPCPDMLANLLDKIHEDTDVYDHDEGQEGDTRRLDMHSGNFMFRNDVLVVTDPWCEVDMTDNVDVSEWVERFSNKTFKSDHHTYW